MQDKNLLNAATYLKYHYIVCTRFLSPANSILSTQNFR